MDLKAFGGALIGAFYGGLGYAVSKAKNNEAFSPVKFVKTVAIGTVVGLASQGTGLSMDTIEGMSTVGFFTIIVDKVAGLFESKPKA